MKTTSNILILTLILSFACFTENSFGLTPQEMDAEFQKSEEPNKNNNYSLVKKIVTPLAESGHAKSQTRLGAIYYYGLGEKKVLCFRLSLFCCFLIPLESLF